jgi:capsular exopolysaccharide synthesis family protein
VLVIDAALRQPALHEAFQLPNDVGLSDVLQDRLPLQTAIQQYGSSDLFVLPSGPSSRNPAGLLGSRRMTALLEQVAGQFDLVLIDSPALLAVAEGSLLAAAADAVLLVVACTQSQEAVVRSAVQQLAAVQARSFVVVNRTPLEEMYAAYPRASLATLRRESIHVR